MIRRALSGARIQGPELGQHQHTVLHNLEVEQAIIGACIVDNSLIPLLAEHLQADDFHEALHQWIVDLIFEQEQASKAVTPLTLAAWLKHHPAFMEVGGHSYLAELALAAPAMPNIRDLAKIVAGHAARRRAVDVLEDAKLALYDNKPIVQALADVSVVADEIAARESEGGDSTGAGQVTHTLLRDIERQAVSEIAYACKTGIKDLDDIIGGLVPGNFIIIGGRPGMGKSIVGAELCIAAARQGWEPDYFSLEMPARELGARMICALDYEDAISEGHKVLKYQELIQLSAKGDALHRAARVNVEKLQPLKIDIFDFEDVTMARIAAIVRARAAKAARRGVRKLTVIDHLGLIEPDERYRGRKVDELTLITKRGKQLAKRTGTPIVMLAQLNREVEGRDDKRPRMSDFRDSGSIEQDADVLIGLYRGEYYDSQAIREAKTQEQRASKQTAAETHKDVLEFLVHKNRNGKTGDAKCHINVKCGAIRNERPVRVHVTTLMERIDDPINRLDDAMPDYSDEISRGGR